MICRSHGTRNCTQPMCKQQRLREQSRAAAAAAEAAGTAPPAASGSSSSAAGGTTTRTTTTASTVARGTALGKATGAKPQGMWEVRTFGALPTTFRGAEPGEIWVGPLPIAGDIVGHLPGTPCLNDGVNPDDSGLWEGWGRVIAPGARIELTEKSAVTTTDGTDLVAVRWCRHCKDLGC
jgi:hypothetical protein